LRGLFQEITGLNPSITDTMGYAFTFHVVSILAQVPVGAYIHYPTISTDMLKRVKSRKRWHTNSDIISSSSVLSYGKLLYVVLSLRSFRDTDVGPTGIIDYSCIIIPSPCDGLPS
jgi:hypothetical protein